MKILHLADVHFHESTLADLAAPCARILEIAKAQNVDHVIVAGDLTTERGLIDNATAVAVRSFVADLAAVAPTWVLAGNHDLTFREGQPNNLRAILADRSGSVLENVEVVDHPKVVSVRDGYGRDVAFCFVPYPSVPTFHAITGSSDLGEVSDRLVDVVEGLKAESTVVGGPSLLIYHGTVEGGRTGDEGSPGFRTRGTDIVLPTASLVGFDAALCGHLHHPQDIPFREGFAAYPGCVAPLTFGERDIKPGVIVWDLDGPTIVYERHLLPVTHQRLQVEIGPNDWDESADAATNLRAWVGGLKVDPHSYVGARVKVKATLPKPRLALLTSELVEVVQRAFNLDRLVIEKTEHEVSKLLLDDGQDRAARVDVVESLATYGEYIEDPAYVANLDEIQVVGREIEDEVRSDHADPRYEFEPLELRVENYKQLSDVVVRFNELPERTGVLGATGVGKSNLILAIAAALYGSNPKSEGGKAKASLASMVRRGHKTGSIVLVFDANGTTYRITRKYSVNGKGVGSSELYFERFAGEWTPINEGTSRETQAAIERIVGPEALHWLTRHLRQHGVSAVKMTAGDLADAINATLQLDFDARADLAKAKLGAAVQASTAARTRRETIADQIVPESKIEAQEEHVRRLKQDAEANGRRDQEHVERMEADRDELIRRRARYAADVERLGDIKRRRDQLVEQSAGAARRCEELESAADALCPAPDVAEAEADAAAARDRADEAQAELARLKDEAHAAELDEARTLGALWQSRTAVATKRQEAYQRLQAAKRLVNDAASSEALIGRVPCRGETWNDPVEGEMEGGACELLAKAQADAKALPDLVAKVADLEATLKAADEDHAVALRMVNEYRESAEGRRVERGERVRAAEAAVATTAADVRATVESARAARERVSKQDEIERQLAPARERLALIEQQLDEVTLNEGHLAEQRAALDDANRQLVELDRLLTARREQVAKYREQLGRCEADLEQLALERVQRADQMKTIEQLKRDEATAERRRLALDYYRRAVGRDGIPSLLLEQLAPQLEARVNDILSPTGRALKVETSRVLASGKTKTEVTLSFRSPSSGDVFVPIAELSGGEEDLANLALAAGLARVSADMSGTELGTVILDEPCAGVSESLQSETLEVLARIGQHVRRSIVVTHRRDLAAVCDSVLEVSRNGDGSSHVEVLN